MELRVRGDKYSYSMQDARGRFRIAREGKLGEAYQRAHLTEKFGEQKEQLQRDPEGYRRRLKEEKTGRYSWQRDLRGRISEALKTSKDHGSFQSAMERQGVKAARDEHGRYRFEFRDRHDLNHKDIAAEPVVPGDAGPDQ